VLLPLDAAAFDAACAPVAPALRLADLLAGARAALLVGSGGRAFFDAFFDRRVADPDPGAANPLDRYTRAVVEDAARAALGPLGVAHTQRYPFVEQAGPHLPFQRLGRVAGLGGPGPLGLQIHPTYGPWWAYRALIVVDTPLTPAASPGDGCAGCDAPCVAACPAGAVQVTGFVVPACHARRLVAEPCRLSCVARIACIRGPEHRYRDEELAFHMAASMPRRP
jgi:ferredoxin